jgi:hypothetical protein
MPNSILQIIAVIAIVLGGIKFQLGSVDLNAERILILPIALEFIISALIFVRLPRDAATIFLFSWILFSIISLLFSSDPAGHISGLLVTSVSFFYFLLFRTTNLGRESVAAIMSAALWPATIGAVVVYALWVTNGMFPNAIDRGRVALTMNESNTFGSMLATFSLIHLGAAKFNFKTLILQFLCIVALLLAFSKGPLVAYVIGAAYYLIRSGSLKNIRAIAIAALSGLSLIALGIVLYDKLARIYGESLDRPDAITSRLWILESAWDRFLKSPIIGNGPLDFTFSSPELLNRLGSNNEQNLWIWQMAVAILHDTGIIGGLIYLLFLIFLFRRSEIWIRSGRDEFVGYTAGFIALLVACQSTTVHLSAIFGLAAGLACSTPVIRRRRVQEGRPSSAMQRR